VRIYIHVEAVSLSRPFEIKKNWRNKRNFFAHQNAVQLWGPIKKTCT
jgi:hypothetical protein